MKFLNKIIRFFIINNDKLKGSEHELMCFKSIKGKFFVVYSDGKKSQMMDYYCAKGYAQIFDGKVHHIKYGEL